MAELVCRSDDARWLAERRTGVTATDIPAILGLSTWDSLYACYWRKVGGYADPAENDRLRLGRELEPYIVGRWRESQFTYSRLSDSSSLYRSVERPWQLATPDRTVNNGPLECKSWGTTDGWGPDGTDVMPVQVRAQVLWQMDTLAASAGHVGTVFLPSGEFRSYRLAHDHVEWRDDVTGLMSGAGALACQLCTDQQMMRAAGFEFWRRVTELDPPTPDGSAATLAALKARFGRSEERKVAQIDPVIMVGWDGARSAEKQFAARRREYEAFMREQAGDATHYAVGDDVFARREVFTTHVREHDRVTDRLMPVKPGKDDDDE